MYYPKNKTERKTCSPNINSKQSASVNSEGGGWGGTIGCDFYMYCLTTSQGEAGPPLPCDNGERCCGV